MATSLEVTFTGSIKVETGINDGALNTFDIVTVINGLPDEQQAFYYFSLEKDLITYKATAQPMLSFESDVELLETSPNERMVLEPAGTHEVYVLNTGNEPRVYTVTYTGASRLAVGSVLMLIIAM